jgi:hypothetical protein
MSDSLVVDRPTGHAEIEYKRTDDGWSVRTPVSEEWHRFAVENADEMAVRQLIRKKWSDNYAVEPDDLADYS